MTSTNAIGHLKFIFSASDGLATDAVTTHAFDQQCSVKILSFTT